MKRILSVAALSLLASAGAAYAAAPEAVRAFIEACPLPCC
jgi:hypothetical protein